MRWKEKIVSLDEAVKQLQPGMRVYISSGSAEPRALIKHLMASKNPNIQDLELIQIASFADAISLQNLKRQKFRLKVFFSGWMAGEAIASGHVDLIPCDPYRIPELFQKGKIKVDAVLVQITPPDENGYCSLGLSVDAVRPAMDQASLLVGEINPLVPRTTGDTSVLVSVFDMLVESDEQPVYFQRNPVDPVFERIADHIEPLIEDQSCIAFSLGPLFEAVGPALSRQYYQSF